MSNLKAIAPYFTSLILLGILLYQNSGSGDSSAEAENYSVDSTLVSLLTKKIEGNAQTIAPQPVTVFVPNTANNEALREYQELKSEVARMHKYIEAITPRRYAQVYEDSTVIITVSDSVHGYLKHQDVEWTIKPQEVSFKRYDTTRYVKERFAITGGVSAFSGETPALGLQLGFRKKGVEFSLGSTTAKQVYISVSKDLFTKYDR